MRFSVLSSGSSGNATYLERSGGSGGLLIDAGLSVRRLKPLLGSIGRSIEDVGAVLLTHAHSDHTCGLRTLRKERPVPVFCAPGVGEKFGAKVIEAGKPFSVSGLEAIFFEVPHDAPTCGVKLSDEDTAMAVATDFGEVREDVYRILRGVDALVVEANHDVEWLRRGPYPQHLKQRIASGEGHLSNDQASELALSLAMHGLAEVVLAHLSDTNNSPARATGTVSRMLREAGFPEIRVRAALPKRPTPWVEVGVPVADPVRFVYGGSRSSEPGSLFGVFEGGDQGTP
ncbi:MAG: MBL fold metallo-hydrolase [Rubrobacter sp.]